MTSQTITADEFKEQATKAAHLLKAMSNETRLMILCRLCGGEVSVSELQADFQMTQSAISQHLAMLREAGIVATRRESQLIFYSVADPAAAKVIETLVAIYCPQ